MVRRVDIKYKNEFGTKVFLLLVLTVTIPNVYK